MTLFDAPADPDAPLVRAAKYGDRWYQTAAVAQIREAYDAARAAGEPVCRRLLVMGTGGGKTLTIGRLLEEFDEEGRRSPLRMVFLVHAEQLVYQTAARFREAFPSLVVHVEKAGDRADLTRADVVVASVQTLGRADTTHPRRWSRRLRRFPGPLIVVVDETHRLPLRGQTARILDYFGVGAEPHGDRRPAWDLPVLLVGASASPHRSDGALAKFYDDYVRNPRATPDESARGQDTFDLRLLIEEGYLVEPKAVRIETGLDLSGVKTRRGDFDQKELEVTVNEEDRNRLIVKAFQEHGGGAFIAFTSGVAHSKALAEMFCAAGVPAAHVDGTMKKFERDQIYRQFEAREIVGITNDSVLREGADFPLCDTILSARPTKSHVRYLQEVGRGTRPLCDVNLPTREARLAAIAASPKPHFTIVDFCDMAGKVPLVKAPSLVGLPSAFDARGGRLITRVAKAVERAERENPTKRIREAVSLDDVEVRARTVNVWDAVEVEPAVLEASPNQWMRAGEDAVQLRVPASRKGMSEAGPSEDFVSRVVPDALGQFRVDTVYPRRYDKAERRYLDERVVPGKKRFESKEAAMAAVDAYVSTALPSVGRLVDRAGGRGKRPTDKQIGFFRRLVPDCPVTEAGRPVHPGTGRALDAADVSQLIDAALSEKKR